VRRWLGIVVAVAAAVTVVLVVNGPTAQAAASPFELLSVDLGGSALTGTTSITASSTGQLVAFAQAGNGCDTLFLRDRGAKTTTPLGTGRLPTITPDGTKGVSVTCDPTPSVTRWPDGKSVVLTGATGVTELAVSATGQFVAVVAAGGLSLVDMTSSTIVAVTAPNGAATSPVFYDDGTPRLGFVSGTVANRVALSAPTAPEPLPGAPSGPVTNLSISSKGETAAFGVPNATSVSFGGGAAVPLLAGGSDPSVSADGTSIAVTAAGSIKTFAVGSNTAHDAATAAPLAAGSFSTPVATNGGREIVFLATPGSAAGGGSGPQAFALRPGLTADDVDYGTVPIDTTTTKTITFRNNGTVDVTPTTIASSNPTDFAVVTGGTCAVGQVIKVGATCTVPVGFTPTGNGAKESTLSITQPGDPSWDSVNSSVRLTGTGANGALTADPDTIDFGTVSVGQSASARSFTVTNSGTLTTTIGTVLVSSPSEFPLAGGTCAGATLAPAATCTVSVAFKPAAAGSRSATMDVGGSGGASVSVALSGTGRSVPPTTTAPPARPALTASPSALDFGTAFVGAAASPQTVTIRNTGNAATTPAATVTGAAAGEFAITVNGCNGRSLSAGASCPLTVAFSPSAAGARTATLTITGTGGASAVARLSGTGQLNPVIAVSPGLVVPGQVLTAVGTNFPPSVAVTLAWDIGGPAVTTAADAAGSFSVAVVAPNGVGDGTRLLVVTAPPEATSAHASVLLQPAVGFQGPASPAFRNSPASG
jgi:hypothetical protein